MILELLVPNGFLYKGTAMMAISLYITYKLVDRKRTYKGE